MTALTPDWTSDKPFAGPDVRGTLICWDCGAKWTSGDNGSHSCVRTLQAHCRRLADEVKVATFAFNSKLVIADLLGEEVKRLKAEAAEQEQRIKLLEASEARIMNDAVVTGAAYEAEIAELKALREEDAEIRSMLFASGQQAEARYGAAQAEERALLARCLGAADELGDNALSDALRAYLGRP